ncbi:putative fatty acyl-CoA reductase CG5065 [Planococcus citri]|uniref:putative fatty acyl-CoA reductase CG5065 n=1 Tax=Planococcus citri TaxID=170843 RepID=UPI0031FA0C49
MSTNKLNMTEGSLIEWYAGRTVLVTGGTGFMGKVLLEKMLRCIPDLKRIYVLCRPKKGFSPATRIEELSKLPLFDKLRKSNPSVFKKLVAIEGDLTQKDLGLTPESKETLLNEVSVVINGAASLRLEAGLKAAVEHNTVGTLRILDLSCQMKHLKAFVHLSTAFCHCEYDVLDEIIYPSPVNPRDVIQMVSWMDETTLEAITPRLLGPHPNCYTYSKRLSEALVSEYADKIPVAVARPSIVTPALYEPMPGWVDSLNGPVGVVVAAGKGIIRSMMVAEEFCAEVIPVDVAINAIIAIAWERGRSSKDLEEKVPVYNVSNGDIQTMTWGEILKDGKKLSYEYPFEAGLWYPNGTIRMNPITHYLIVLFCQIIPAYFIDALLFLMGQKTFMVRVQKRIYVGMGVLQYFTTRKWKFLNQKTIALTNKLSDKELKIFYLGNTKPDTQKYLLDVLLGARQYCMKEPLSTLPKARFQLKLLYWLDWVAQILLWGTLTYYIAKWTNLSNTLNQYINLNGS